MTIKRRMTTTNGTPRCTVMLTNCDGTHIKSVAHRQQAGIDGDTDHVILRSRGNTKQ